jgi:predicted dehydrogenase
LINRILIIGLGSIGKRHLRIARELLPNADIRVLRHQVDIEVPEHSNGIFFTIDEALTFAPQMAVIASPAPFHINTALVLAELGVHLLVEKPLSTSLSGVTELLEVCERKRVVLLIGYNLRFLPSLQRYRDLLDENAIGKVLSVRSEIGQYLPSWRPSSDYRKGVSARKELGGGALLELSHELDYLRWIFGEIDWVKSTLSRQSHLEINVEDTAHLVLGFSPAVDGHQLIGTVDMDFIRHDTTRLCTAIGEKGSLRWNGLTGEVSIYEVGSNAWRELSRLPHQIDDSYIAEWKNFIDCVTEQKSPLISGDDGLKVLQIIEAVRSSELSFGQLFEIKQMHAGKTTV